LDLKGKVEGNTKRETKNLIYACIYYSKGLHGKWGRKQKRRVTEGKNEKRPLDEIEELGGAA